MNHDIDQLKGFRIDGRKYNEVRNIQSKFGICSEYDGSSYFKQGLTEILCLIQGPRENKNRENLLNINFVSLVMTGLDKTRKMKQDRDKQEFAENLRITFEDLIIQENYQRSQIDISLILIQSDGGSKAAAINALYLALLDAGVAMKDFLVGCNFGIVNGEILLDLTNNEQNEASVDGVIAILMKSKDIALLDLKGSKTTKRDFERLTNIALNGCQHIYLTLRDKVLDLSMRNLITSR